MRRLAADQFLRQYVASPRRSFGSQPRQGDHQPVQLATVAKHLSSLPRLLQRQITGLRCRTLSQRYRDVRLPVLIRDCDGPFLSTGGEGMRRAFSIPPCTRGAGMRQASFPPCTQGGEGGFLDHPGRFHETRFRRSSAGKSSRCATDLEDRDYTHVLSSHRHESFARWPPLSLVVEFPPEGRRRGTRSLVAAVPPWVCCHPASGCVGSAGSGLPVSFWKRSRNNSGHGRGSGSA